ncbi:MAG: Fic family protein [Pseudomonadota bacterium]
MTNEELDQKLYRWPGSDVLKNKLGIRDATELDKEERVLVGLRIRDGAPKGDFSLEHLQAIHKHLFQDIFDWAGEIRQVDISKSHWFMPKDRIGTAFQDISKRLDQANMLKGLSPRDFAEEAGPIFGDVNYAHPFREGNGRTQFQYFRQLSAQAGHDFDERRLTRNEWISASIAANEANYAPMIDQVGKAIDPGREKGPIGRALSQSYQAMKTDGVYKPSRGDRDR